MEAAQALMKYKEKARPKARPKAQPKAETNPSTSYPTHREIEWFRKLCPKFDQNIDNILHLKKH